MANNKNHSKYKCKTCTKDVPLEAVYMGYLKDFETQRNDDAEDFDPQYNTFLDSVRQVENLLIVEANENNALPKSYIMEDHSEDALDQDIWMERRNKIGESIADVSNLSSPENQRNEIIEMIVNPDPFVHCFDKETNNKASNMQDGPTKRCNSKHAEMYGKLTKRGQFKADNIDHDYACFLKDYFNRFDDAGNGLLIHMDPPVSSMEENPKILAHIEGSNVNEDDSYDCLEKDPPFREQLMKVLRKPVDMAELQTLVGLMEATKPVERHLDLRFGREKSYVTNKDGKSYLDHFPDLRRKLEAADCWRQELKLLRGFFFWIQNLSQEGAFRPWKDEACLAFEPEDE